jgi:hypothetical protein
MGNCLRWCRARSPPAIASLRFTGSKTLNVRPLGAYVRCLTAVPGFGDGLRRQGRTIRKALWFGIGHPVASAISANVQYRIRFCARVLAVSRRRASDAGKVPSNPASRAASRRSCSAFFCSLSCLDLGPLKVNAMRPLPVVDSRALRCAGPRPAMHFPNRTVGHAYRLGFAMPLDRCHNVTKASQYRQAF